MSFSMHGDFWGYLPSSVPPFLSNPSSDSILFAPYIESPVLFIGPSSSEYHQIDFPGGYFLVESSLCCSPGKCLSRSSGYTTVVFGFVHRCHPFSPTNLFLWSCNSPWTPPTFFRKGATMLSFAPLAEEGPYPDLAFFVSLPKKIGSKLFQPDSKRRA